MSQYDNTGKAAAWKPKKDTHPLSIKCNAHRDIAKGEDFEVAIWPQREKKSENSPDYTGNVQDKWVPQEKQGYDGPATNPIGEAPADFNDDIPF